MKVIEISEQDFDEKVLSSKKALVDCYADWCGPCKIIAQAIEEIAKEHEDIDFFKINMEDADDVSDKYDIMSIPTLLLFENGKLKAQITGNKSKVEIEQFIK